MTTATAVECTGHQKVDNLTREQVVEGMQRLIQDLEGDATFTTASATLHEVKADDGRTGFVVEFTVMGIGHE